MIQIIKVPNKLRGQKIVPLIEWCNQNTNSYENISEYEYNTYLKVKEFKSQPFSVDMLIGDNRLFEGWEKRKGLLSIFSIDGKLKLAEYEINKFTVYELDQKDEYYEKKIFEFLTVKSLNDFITLCTLAGVDLGVWK